MKRQRPAPESLAPVATRGGRAAGGRGPLRAPRRHRPRIRTRLPGPDRRLERRRADLRRGLPARGPAPGGGALRDPPGPARRGPALGWAWRGRARAELRLPFAWGAVSLQGAGAAALRVALRPQGGEGLSLAIADGEGAPSRRSARSPCARSTPPSCGARGRVGMGCSRSSWQELALEREPQELTETADLLAVGTEGEEVPGLVLWRPQLDKATISPRPPARSPSRSSSSCRAGSREERLAAARLAILTQGAVAARAEESPDPATAAIWGLLRSAQSEHPGRFALIDSDGTEASEEALAAALALDRGAPARPARGRGAGAAGHPRPRRRWHADPARRAMAPGCGQARHAGEPRAGSQPRGAAEPLGPTEVRIADARRRAQLPRRRCRPRPLPRRGADRQRGRRRRGRGRRRGHRPRPRRPGDGDDLTTPSARWRPPSASCSPRSPRAGASSRPPRCRSSSSPPTTASPTSPI